MVTAAMQPWLSWFIHAMHQSQPKLITFSLASLSILTLDAVHRPPRHSIQAFHGLPTSTLSREGVSWRREWRVLDARWKPGKDSFKSRMDMNRHVTWVIFVQLKSIRKESKALFFFLKFLYSEDDFFAARKESQPPPTLTSISSMVVPVTHSPS